MKPVRGRTYQVREAPIQKLLSESKVPEDVVDFGQGVPFFGPPREAVLAAAEALDKEHGFKYSPDAGLPSLREAIARKLINENGVKADPETNIMVTSGANQAFSNAILSVTKPGDQVIILAPYYFNHIMAVQLAGCKPVIVDTDSDYQPTVKRIGEKVSRSTRAIVLVSPNNPTGAVYDKNQTKEIEVLCREKDLYLITDDTYEHFVYDDARYTSALEFDKRIDHTVLLYSFSKSYGMSGYRIGYAVFPEHLYADMLKVQDTLTICPPSPLQYGAEAAIALGAAYLKKFMPSIEKVRRVFIERLVGVSGVEMPITKGSYYFLLRLRTKEKDWTIAKKLIEEDGVITVPGEAFGTKYPALRVAYANVDEQRAEEGIRRLKRGLEEILHK